MMGMFVIGSLIQRWVSITFTPVVSTVKQQKGAYIDWEKLPAGAKGLKEAFTQYAAGRSLSETKVTTLQDNLDQLVPGLAALGLTFLCMYLLKHKVSLNERPAAYCVNASFKPFAPAGSFSQSM